jgi:penicillin-binding protein 1A
MVEVGFITPAEEAAALRQPLKMKPYRPDWIKECGYFNEHVRTLLENRFGRDSVYNLGLRVYTTADVALHQAGQEAIRQGIEGLVQRNGYRGPLRHLRGKELAAYQERQNRYYRKYPSRKGQLATAVVAQRDKKSPVVNLRLGEQWAVLEEAATGGPRASSLQAALKPGDVVQVRLKNRDRRTGKWTATLVPAPMVQAALVSMELRTGRVRVLIGGKDFGDSTFNRATQARRQPGSAFKPVIYAAAVDQGYSPNSTLLDEPLSLPGGRRGQAWTPQNYDHSFSGPISLATALARSRNVPTVRLMMAIGVPATIKMAQTLGITTPIFPNYASALGASEVTLFELTRAYSVFPNDGQLVAPIFIERIEDRDGRILLESQPSRQQVLQPATAQIMTYLLRGVVERGTGTRVKAALRRPMGGKTGTTNRTRDAWFIGFTPSLITGAWVGMDDERTLGGRETGSQAAAPIFIAYMREALRNQPVEEFPELSGALLARRGKEPQASGQDEEQTPNPDESFYPEDETNQDKSPRPQASSQQFFKSDMEE